MFSLLRMWLFITTMRQALFHKIRCWQPDKKAADKTGRRVWEILDQSAADKTTPTAPTPSEHSARRRVLTPTFSVGSARLEPPQSVDEKVNGMQWFCL